MKADVRTSRGDLNFKRRNIEEERLMEEVLSFFWSLATYLLSPDELHRVIRVYWRSEGLYNLFG